MSRSPRNDAAGARARSVIRSASLCPTRTTEDGLEVLLVRRAFWNHLKQRPMRYPGEWSFAGGAHEEGDKDLAATAVREFREELRYEGPVTDTMLLHAAHQDWRGRPYYVEFHAARIDPSCPFVLAEDGEVIDFRWISPGDALALIRSEEFTRRQLEEFRRRGLDDQRFGVYAVGARQFPEQNVRTLELMLSMPELTET